MKGVSHCFMVEPTITRRELIILYVIEILLDNNYIKQVLEVSLRSP